MQNYICTTCGHQFAESNEPPPHCPICEDDRQYVNPLGQAWTTLDELAQGHHNLVKSLETGLTGIATEPKFAIGQRALLMQGSRGNVLWDCISLIDDATIKAVEALGGISSLAMSHPHLFGSMVEWSHAFGNAPIHLHVDHKPWVQRYDPVIEFWEGETLELKEGLTLRRCGGHFEGSTVLLWPDGADRKGALLTGDTMYVAPDRKHVSFMYSYPNFIPLSASTVDSIVDKVMPLRFDRIYGHFFGLEIEADAKSVVRRSAERYKQAKGSFARSKEPVVKSDNPQPIFVPPHAGKKLEYPTVTHKLTGQQTGGAYYLFESVVGPGSGNRLHVHRREDEVAYVLEGALEIRLADQTAVVEAGSVAHLPRNIPHAIRNPLETPSHCLFMAIPAGLDQWFDALDAARNDGTLDDAMYRKLSLDYGIEWLE